MATERAASHFRPLSLTFSSKLFHQVAGRARRSGEVSGCHGMIYSLAPVLPPSCSCQMAGSGSVHDGCAHRINRRRYVAGRPTIG